MKKIIYSLVIMIAAGSLFTSCIEQVEPEGVKAIREAKARYYDALSQLRGKDGELRQAEAALKQAEAALKQAEAAHQQAVTDAFTKMQALERQLKELENEQKAEEVKQAIDKIKKEMEIAEKQHEIDLIKKQGELAQAQEDLRLVLSNIALAAQDLTAAEKQAVLDAVNKYDDLFNQVADQKIKVMEAEQALAKAQRAKEMGKSNPDYDWDSETHSYEHVIDLYNKAIERAKGYIAEDEEALKNVPAFEDVEKWGAELAGYQKKADEEEYRRHVLTQEAAAYYVQYVHDGVKAYNDEIDAWIDENPAVAAPGTKPSYKDGAPTYTTKNEITIGNKKYPAGTTFGAAVADSVALPTLELKGTPAYQKFLYILGTYFGEVSPVNETDDIMDVVSGELQVVANQLMKDFILGTEMGNVGTQKFSYTNQAGTKVNLVADYGLKGAVSVLKRDKVLNPDTPTDPEEAKKAAEDAKKAWQADHDTLAAGLLKYQPYIDAKKALEAAQKDADANGSGMVKAIEDLLESINLVNVSPSPITYSGKDTLGLINDIVAFAKAREKYLDYTNVTGATKDSNYFYYSVASAPATPGSVKFADMTKAGFVEQDRGTAGKNGAYAFLEDGTLTTLTPHEAFAEVINQLFGAQMAAKITGETTFTDAEWENLINDGANYTAFYKTYKYVAKTTTEPAKITYIDGSPYTPKDLADAQAAVDAAIADYKACYERYWNETWPATGLIDYTTSEADVKTILEANAEINIDIYTLKTFTDPFIITNETDPTQPLWIAANVPFGTNALAAILGSVDKAATDPIAGNLEFFGGSTESVVFGTAAKPTDLNKYLYAEYLYFLALNPASGDIKVIEEWVAAVEKAFTDGAADAVAAAKAAYEADLAVYEKNKAGYDAYQEKLKAFTGVRTVDGKEVINGLRKITGAYADVASIQYNFELVDVIDGEWIETLGGEQLKLAEKYFPEFPAKLKGWYEENEAIDDEIAHMNILINALKPVYAASAQVIGHDEYPVWVRDGKGKINTDGTTNIYDANFTTLVKNYEDARKAYIKAIEDDIETQNGNIDTNMKLIADFESGADILDLAIAKAQAELDKANKKLESLEKQLADAKASLDRILAYIAEQEQKL